MAGTTAREPDEKLVRALGVPTLTASIVNATIGVGIFVFPAIVAAGLGAAAPIAFVICAVVMALVVTSFAIAGSRVSLTGGLYAYVEAAFGPYVGFLAGVLLWLGNVLAVAGVASAFVASVALILPIVQSGFGRFFLLVLIFLALAIINIRGVRGGAGTVAAMTIAKLLPLLFFIAVGVFFIKPAALGWSVWPGADAIGKAVLLLIFAFMGVELALVPSGEVKSPARTVPPRSFSRSRSPPRSTSRSNSSRKASSAPRSQISRMRPWPRRLPVFSETRGGPFFWPARRLPLSGA